jgi:cyclase
MKTVVTFAFAVIACSAQYQSSGREKSAGESALHADLVKTGLYVISGGGCNSLLRLSANGLIIVDGKLPGNYDALMSQATRISEQPVRLLIETDYHPTHTGNNANFLAAGAQIVAQENVKGATRTFDRELKLTLGGVEAELMHFGNARTNGDTVVYFPNLKVVAVGDLFASTPDPDFSAGGSLVGWGPVLAQVLKLDFDVVVPGNGPPVSRADLEAFRNKIDTLVSRAAGLVKKGVPRDRLMAQLKTDDLGWRLRFTPDQVERFYAELSAVK